MPTLDKKLREVAFRLIQDKGQTVVYTRVIEGDPTVYDEASGQFGVPTLVPGMVKISPPESPKGEMLRTGQVLTSDLMFVLAAKGLPAELAAFDTPNADPKPNDKVSIGGVEWTVKQAQVTYSGEQKAIWDVVVGR